MYSAWYSSWQYAYVQLICSMAAWQQTENKEKGITQKTYVPLTTLWWTIFTVPGNKNIFCKSSQEQNRSYLSNGTKILSHPSAFRSFVQKLQAANWFLKTKTLNYQLSVWAAVTCLWECLVCLCCCVGELLDVNLDKRTIETWDAIKPHVRRGRRRRRMIIMILAFHHCFMCFINLHCTTLNKWSLLLARGKSRYCPSIYRQHNNKTLF